ncbi:EAL domain-containing protein [Pseudemcibacter aquimaris]|uniref:EAL domain-containing protein n=1 Tax=Pseudemcibacter aquimaris TaxID=2857064 RepID=UPI0020125065|nr:EAL domain-containing protein [Pseudemcibacter aquimaris]MCC3860769.1 EAL domain-containing protein [Pseudemcibacter aquimaris]WDU59587.1 EAL domain-containing protein [Pseudemcibacter aquimaris]
MAIYLWAFHGEFNAGLQYLWLMVMVVLYAARLFMITVPKRENFEDNAKKWLYLYAGVTFAMGIGWGMMTYIPADGVVADSTNMVIVTMLLALCCISAISSSAHPYMIWTFMTPIAILSSTNLLNAATNQFDMVLGIGVFVFCIFAGFVGHNLSNTLVDALYLQKRNSVLMDDVVEIARQNQKSYEGFQLLLDNLGAGAAMFDKDKKLMSWNKSFENIFNLPAGIIQRGMTLKELIRRIIKQSWQNNIDIDHAAETHLKEILEDRSEDNLVKLVMADGRNLYSKVMKISDDQMVLNYTDVTSLEQARTEDIIHVLQHDSLTGLPNQVLHKKEVRKRIVDFRRAATANKSVKETQFMALIYLGLNSLNEIYEFLGLSAGDQVVTEIAKKCQNFLSGDVHLSHVAYDEFHIITCNENNVGEVLKLVNELMEVLSEPIEVGENSITVTMSIGISVYPEHADKTDILNRNAKIAFNKAKSPHTSNVVIYDHGMHSEIMERSNILFDIRESMKKSEFLLHYQPQIDIESRDVLGVEALLRWEHPVKGSISPGHFIPLVEHTKQIIPLTEQFLPEACLQAKKWQDQGLPPLKMSVNISPFHFYEMNFSAFVRECFEGAGLEPEFLELEITEGVIMNQTEEIIKILQELSEMGVQLSIDDFGTGYSSLAYLRSLPVDKLKIDQAFIKDMCADNNSRSLVEAVIRMGHSFNLDVIAEGVETEEQLLDLQKMRCDQAQGFYIRKPASSDEITSWIKQHYA